MSSAELIRGMQRAGWRLDRVDRPGHVVVPHPKKDLGLGLVKAIRRLAGI